MPWIVHSLDDQPERDPTLVAQAAFFANEPTLDERLERRLGSGVRESDIRCENPPSEKCDVSVIGYREVVGDPGQQASLVRWNSFVAQSLQRQPHDPLPHWFCPRIRGRAWRFVIRRWLAIVVVVGIDRRVADPQLMLDAQTVEGCD